MSDALVRYCGLGELEGVRQKCAAAARSGRSASPIARRLQVQLLEVGHTETVTCCIAELVLVCECASA